MDPVTTPEHQQAHALATILEALGYTSVAVDPPTRAGGRYAITVKHDGTLREVIIPAGGLTDVRMYRLLKSIVAQW